MFIEPTIISLIVGKIRGGSIKNMEEIHIKGWYIFFISAFIQLFISFSKRFDFPWSEKILTDYFLLLILISYLLIIFTVLLNIEKKYMKVFLIGIGLNFLVIMANGGRMPVSMKDVSGSNMEKIIAEREYDIKHVAINEDTQLRYLADIILIPKPYPLAKIVSLGDLFIMLGIFLLFQEEMYKKDKSN